MNCHRLSRYSIGFLVSIFIATGASASPKELVEQYLQVSEDFVRVKAKKEVAESQYDEAKSSFFPSVNLVTNYTDSKSIFNLGSQKITSEAGQYTSAVEFMQPIYLGGKIWNAFNLRTLERDFSQHEFIQEKNTVVKVFLAAVLELGVLEGQLIVAKELYATQSRLLKTTRSKNKRGSVNPFDLDQVESDYYAYESKLESVRAGIEIAKSRLGVLLKRPASDLGVDALQFLESVQISDLPGQANYALKSAEMQLELAVISKGLSLGDDYPSLSVSGRYGYQASDFSGIGDSSNQIHSYGVTLTIPLFSGLSSVYKRRAGEAQVYSARKNLELAKRDSVATINDLNAKVSSSIKVLRSTKRWREKAKLAYKKSVQAFGVGRANSLQVLQLQTAFERAENSYLEAKKNLILLKVMLGSAQGADVLSGIN